MRILVVEDEKAQLNYRTASRQSPAAYANAVFASAAGQAAAPLAIWILDSIYKDAS